MTPRSRFASLVLLLASIVASIARGQESARQESRAAKQLADSIPAPIDPPVFARRVLATTDLVLKRHVDPPTRQAMIAAAVKSLFAKVEHPAPIGLGRRVSLAKSDDELQQLLEQAWASARTSSRGPDAALQTAALAGIFSQVAEKPQIIPSGEFKVQQQIRGNRYVGIGIQLGMESDADGPWPVIQNPFPRGPARLSGAKPGDRILEVNGASMKAKNLEQVVNVVRGDEGSPVTLVVRAADGGERRTLNITRGVIPFQSFAGYRRVSENEWEYRPNESEAIGYLQLTAIRASTLSELRRLATVLDAQGIHALVLDLRFTGADADLQHAVLVADELLEEGPIGRVIDYNGTQKEFRSGPDCQFRRWPIVVLVNQYTRGEAEFLAAALQDNHRAVIVGEHTPGLAFVHSPVELPDGIGGVVLRTGLLFRGDGRPLQSESNPDAAHDLQTVRTVPPAPPVNATTANPQEVQELLEAAARKSANPEELRKLLDAYEQFVAAATPRANSSNPPRHVEIPVGDKKLRLLVSGDVADRFEQSKSHVGGVSPDHTVAMPNDQLAAWYGWRREQDLPEPPAAGRTPPPADPQLKKAIEILRAALKDPAPQ